MNHLFKKTALLLSLLMLLFAFAGCTDGFETGDPASKGSPSGSLESGSKESTPATPSKEQSETPVSPSDSEQTSPSVDPALPIHKDNAHEKLLAGYNATMSASSVKLSGVVSNYTAGSGKGDTVSHGISFSSTKDGGVFKATLSYGGSYEDTECYFEGSKKYTKLTSKETGEATVTTFESSTEYTIANTVIPVLSENMTITSYDNAFRRFSETDFGVELKDGVYTLYFYGSYTEIARICLEDQVYESFLSQKVEEQFTTSGAIEIRLTEDGYFVGMTTEINLESDAKSMKSTISYNFSDFNGSVSVERPDFAKEA